MSDTPPIAELTGPMVVGLCLNWGLFGCASVQTYQYYCSFPNDRKLLKTLVYSLYFWDLSQTVLLTQAWFAVLGSGWGNPAALEAIGTNWFCVPLMSGVSSATVQCFYGWRVYQLSKSRVLSIFIVMLALAEGLAAVALGIKGATLPNFSVLQETTFAVTSVWLLGSAVCDIVICLAMLYFLHTTRHSSRVVTTQNLLTRIIRLSVGAGLLTAAIAIVDGCLYLTFAHNNFHLAPAAVLGKMYTNSLLVLFNSRQRLRTNEGTPSHYLWEGASVERNMLGVRSVNPMSVNVEVHTNNDSGIQMHPFDSKQRLNAGDTGSVQQHPHRDFE